MHVLIVAGENFEGKNIFSSIFEFHQAAALKNAGHKVVICNIKFTTKKNKVWMEYF